MEDEEPPVIEEQSPWCNLPDLIIEQVLSYLTVRERYYCSMVCRRWHDAFYLPYVWSIFVFDETTLTRRRFNYYSGWQHTLDHLRAQLCLATVGKNFRVLIFSPMTNFYNMYEFMNMFSFYAEQRDGGKLTVKGIGRNVHTLRYTFPCNLLARFEEDQVSRLYGTGGKLLEAVKRLMGNLRRLKHLELTDLLLDSLEAKSLLDELSVENTLTLRSISLVNLTKGCCPIIHPGVFLNLQVLEMSPQNLCEDLVELVAQSGLPVLHLHQTENSPGGFTPVSPRCWRLASAASPNLRLHLSLNSTRADKEIIWHERAPVASILYKCPFSKLEDSILNRAVEWYRDTLELFGHLGLPKFSSPKSFTDRADPLILMLVKECKNLKSLVIRERISTCTLLLVAEAGRNRLKEIFVRKNAVILRCDWPRSPDWSTEYYNWLKETCKSYEKTEKEISQILQRPWRMFSDKSFLKVQPKMY